MSSGEIRARHWRSRQPVRVTWQEGVITRMETLTTAMAEERWLAPMLVDLQVSGYAGVDFQRDDLSLEALVHATRQLRADGCGRFLLTLITDAWPKLIARLRRLRQWREQSGELKDSIVGWHLEGPFLSAEPGFHGAHNADSLCDPTSDHIAELREIAGLDLLLLTLAPERRGALAAIGQAVSLGITVSLGHTNASAEILRQAVAAGATGFTHLGNACPQQLDRHDNLLWRVLDTPELTVSLIPDQIHLSPALFRLIHRALPAERVCYITDAVAAAGAGPGRYTTGELEVDVGPDQIVRHPGRSNFAGSALRPIDGVIRAAQMLGRPWQEVWDGFSVRPAEFMGLRHQLAPGEPARFCVIRVSADNCLQEVRVY